MQTIHLFQDTNVFQTLEILFVHNLVSNLRRACKGVLEYRLSFQSLFPSLTKRNYVVMSSVNEVLVAKGNAFGRKHLKGEDTS